MATIDTDKEQKQPTIHRNLILSFTWSEEIIQFNKECELVTEYLRADILHKKFSEILLPNEYLTQWKSLLGTIQQTLEVEEFILPLKTKNNAICQVIWNGFCMKDENGRLMDICLLGTTNPSPGTGLLKNRPDSLSKDNTQKRNHHEIPETRPPTFSDASLSEQQKETGLLKENIVQRNESNAMAILDKSASLGTLERIVENTSKQLDVMSQMIKDLLKKYDSITSRFGELEKNHNDLEKHLSLLEGGSPKPIETNNYALTEKHVPPNEQPFKEKKPGFLSDLFGYKRQRQDLDMKTRELENRKKELDTFEAQFQNEKKIFDTRIEEFNHWRDKLEQLEMEIEKRRQELMKQDQIFFEETQPVSLETQSVESEIVDSTVPETPDYHQILDKIPQSAAIVQRGILKQVNTSFAELIGYSMHEIMEKNFFDFVAVEGLAEIEKYYLNRLKGESITSYKTVFSTKENEKVFVEVTVKPTIYNGEKAEIAIITGLETQKHE